MKAINLGGIEFDESVGNNQDPYIIGVFGAEGVGKTRFGLTGPEVVGCVPLEMKAYKTIDEIGESMGKRILKPSDPTKLLVPTRRVDSMTDVEAQDFYQKHLKIVNNVIYAMLERPDVRTLLIDKWTTYCTWVEFAVNGMSGKKFKKIGDKVFVNMKESNQAIIDVINSFSQYGKTVVLTNSEKAEYANDKPTDRMVYEGFKYLGSHTNVLLHMEENKFWKSGSSDPKKSWKFRLNIRKAQGATHLEGPDGNPLVTDEDVDLAHVIMAIEGDKFDPEKWM